MTHIQASVINFLFKKILWPKEGIIITVISPITDHQFFHTTFLYLQNDSDNSPFLDLPDISCTKGEMKLDKHNLRDSK